METKLVGKITLLKAIRGWREQKKLDSSLKMAEQDLEMLCQIGILEMSNIVGYFEPGMLFKQREREI